MDPGQSRGLSVALTTLANIAGSISVSTAPVVVLSAAAGVSDLALDNPGPGLSAVL